MQQSKQSLKVLYGLYSQLSLSGYYSDAAKEELIKTGSIGQDFPPSQTWLYLKAIRKRFETVDVFLLDHLERDQDVKKYFNRDPFLKRRWEQYQASQNYKAFENAYLNRLFIEKAREMKPDIIWVYIGQSIYPETWEEIRSFLPNCVFVCQIGINPFQIYNEFLIRNLKYFDLYVTNDFQLEPYYAYGLKKGLSVDLACDPDFHFRKELNPATKQRYRSKVCFHGSCYGSRPLFFEQLTDLDLRIWGQKWKERCEDKYDDVLKHFWGELWTTDMIDLYSANPMAINHHIDHSSGINVRAFEIAGCGTVALTDKKYYDHFQYLFEPEKEILFYETAEELKELVKELSEDTKRAEAIGKAAQKRAHQEHTYDHRVDQILIELGV